MGIPVYPPHLDGTHLHGFYEGLAVGELRLTVVEETGEFAWYPPEVVPGRPNATLSWRAIPPDGAAYTFTTITRSLLPGDHSAEVPFTVVLFEPDAAPGCRVPGVLVDADGIEPRCGMRLVFRPVRAGDHWIAGFAPAL